MSNNSTLSLMLAEAAKISAAYKAQPSPAGIQEMHDLHENAKQALSREEYAQFWDAVKPKVSGVPDFAGKGWKRNHPEASASAMPKYIAESQEKRKAEKAAQPKAESKPKTKASQPKAEDKPKAEKASSKRPTYTDTLLSVVSVLERMDKHLEETTSTLKRMDKKLASIESKLK